MIAFANLPLEGVQRRAFHRVPNDGSIVQLNKGMGSGESEGSFTSCFFNVQEF